VMIFVALGIALHRVWSDRINIAKWYLVIGIASYVLINYINVDVIIAEKNMARFHGTGEIDIDYLASMSYATTPYLIELAAERNGEVSFMAKNAVAYRKEILSREYDWQSYNLSEQQARKSLKDFR